MREKIEQYHPVTFILILILILGMSLTGCAEKVQVSAAERDKAVMFYKKLHPLTVELEQINDEWNEWYEQVSQAENKSQVVNKCNYFEAKLIVLASKVGELEAPSKLVNLQNSTFSAINQRAKASALIKQYALTGNDRYFGQAELTLSESMKFLKQATNEYDKGLIKYEIKSSEIGN